MRRAGGTGLTRHEMRLLAAALRLTVQGNPDLYGYELFATLTEWEGAEPMNHGTVYRCLRSLFHSGLLEAYEAPAPERAAHPSRVLYRLTPQGVEVARKVTVRLAGETAPLAWIDVRNALLPTPLVDPP
jgi:DNA-binding PadR family transcriptional regulator